MKPKERNCAWCQSSVPIEQQDCARCGHHAVTPRMLCRCENCVVLNGDWEALFSVDDLFDEETDPSGITFDDILDHL